MQWAGIVVTGIFVAGVVTAGYVRSLEGRANTDHARAMALASLILASVAVTAVLSHLRTSAAKLICLLTVATTIALIQAPALDQWLHLAPLHWDDWGIAIFTALIAGAILLASARWRISRLAK